MRVNEAREQPLTLRIQHIGPLRNHNGSAQTKNLAALNQYGTVKRCTFHRHHMSVRDGQNTLFRRSSGLPNGGADACRIGLGSNSHRLLSALARFTWNRAWLDRNRAWLARRRGRPAGNATWDETGSGGGLRAAHDCLSCAKYGLLQATAYFWPPTERDTRALRAAQMQPIRHRCHISCHISSLKAHDRRLVQCIRK